MKNLILLAVVLGLSTLLVGCSSSCDESSLQEKLKRIEQAVADLSTSGEDEKMMAFTQKMQAIRMQKNQGNLSAACAAADSVLDML